MFIERRINPTTKAVELWHCKWENQMGEAPKKIYLGCIGEEKPLFSSDEKVAEKEPAICWSYGRTLGNIAVFSPDLIGKFPATSGNDAVLPCEFVNAGKFRHGAERWWCRTHQTHWGTKGDQAALNQFGDMRCANHQQLMHYVVSPFTINLNELAEVGIWCSMPAALSTDEIKPRAPKIHVHVRNQVGGKKSVDRDFQAISLLYGDHSGLFKNQEITRVNITPPSAFEFVCNLENNLKMSCVSCSNCGYPHLDLGDFGRTPHKKHFCGNCGRDSTWSNGPIISTPLQPLHDQYAGNFEYWTPDRELNLDSYPGSSYTVWASTPAVLWTSKRPQERGIHVHVRRDGERIIDDTFGRVILKGTELKREELIQMMIKRSIS